VVDPAELERLVGTPLTPSEAEALAKAYATLSAQVASFPDIRHVEPPLRSLPGPRA
jgi:hypothetical protein